MMDEMAAKDKADTQPFKKQDNSDDCGVFMILSIYLISRGVQLQRRTYNQHIVTNRKLRRCIALALMKCNEISAPGAMDGFVTGQRRTATTSSRERKRKRTETRLTAALQARAKLEETLPDRSCRQINLMGFLSIENVQPSHSRINPIGSLQLIRCYSNPQRKQRPT